MHRTFLALLGLLALFSTGCAGESEPMRIMSYNIHIAKGMDGKLDVERIANVIKNANPDLVSLQEVDRNATRTNNLDQPAMLAKLTGMHIAYADTGALKGAGEYGVAILSRWPIEHVITRPLPHGANREPRAALAAEIRHPELGKMLFIATHLQHNSEEDRLAQVEAITNLFPAHQYPRAILAGDLNATPTSKPLAMLLPTWIDAGARDNQPTSPANAPRNRIDYVLLRPTDEWRVVETTVLNEPVASDHLPVITTVIGKKCNCDKKRKPEQSK